MEDSDRNLRGWPGCGDRTLTARAGLEKAAEGTEGAGMSPHLENEPGEEDAEQEKERVWEAGVWCLVGTTLRPDGTLPERHPWGTPASVHWELEMRRTHAGEIDLVLSTQGHKQAQIHTLWSLTRF